MKILKTLDKSAEGNDCYLYRIWELQEIFGETFLILYHKTSGWCGSELEITHWNVNDLDINEYAKSIIAEFNAIDT
jgi:hypothetical protein